VTTSRLSRRAREDLVEIWDYSTRRWGIDQAEPYLREIQAGIKILLETPRLGQGCDEIRLGYRRYRIGSHILFYRIANDGIDIVRILHASMDVERHL
jgi:toxin ParE1/3/4